MRVGGGGAGSWGGSGAARSRSSRQRVDQRLLVPRLIRVRPTATQDVGDVHDTENSWLFGWSVASVAASEGSAAVDEVQVPLERVSTTGRE